MALPVCVGCGSGPASDLATEQHSQAIIDGSPASDYTGIVYIAHPDLPIVCSGTVIAPSLVVTAKHCIIRESSNGDIPLMPDGFQVGFGPDYDQLVWTNASSTDWIGAPDEVDVQPSLDAGEDVGLLYLPDPVPAGTHIHPVDLAYAPASGDAYTLVGFGLSSVTTAAAGAKLSTIDEATAFGAETGIIEATGNGACDGDSGGPYLYGPEDRLVAVVSEIGGSDEDTFCDTGVTYGHSVANSRVNQLLADALSALPPCEAVDEVCDNDQDEDCDGDADDHCGQDNDSCSTDSDCESELCRDIGEGLICVQSCADLDPCRAGYDCWRVEGDEVCVPRAAADAGSAGASAAAGAAGSAGVPSTATEAPSGESNDTGCGCRAVRARATMAGQRQWHVIAWFGILIMCRRLCRRDRLWPAAASRKGEQGAES